MTLLQHNRSILTGLLDGCVDQHSVANTEVFLHIRYLIVMK